jgi:hypothetical protein
MKLVSSVKIGEGQVTQGATELPEQALGPLVNKNTLWDLWTAIEDEEDEEDVGTP